jgi:hypothetical protein
MPSGPDWLPANVVAVMVENEPAALTSPPPKVSPPASTRLRRTWLRDSTKSPWSTLIPPPCVDAWLASIRLSSTVMMPFGVPARKSPCTNRPPATIASLPRTTERETRIDAGRRGGAATFTDCPAMPPPNPPTPSLIAWLPCTMLSRTSSGAR